jgi:hypothetical protein
MNLNAVRRALEEGYEDRGVFEPDEKFWQAVKQVIDMLRGRDRQRMPKKNRTRSISKRDNENT